MASVAACGALVDTGVLTAPAAANTPSRRVLEKNGFELIAVRPVATEPTDEPMAIYRLPAATAQRSRHDISPGG